MKTQTALHLSALAVALDRHLSGNPTNNPAQTIHELHRLGAALHKRYTAACNYVWATTPAYEKRTENMERKLLKVAEAAGFTQCPEFELQDKCGGLYISLQRDPRGWPVTLSIGGRVDYVGGEVV